jgi:hypothetical protein
MVAVVVVFTSLAGCMQARHPKSQWIGTGTLIVLSITLITVAIYAYDTHSIAGATRWQLMRDGILSVTYGMRMARVGVFLDRTLFVFDNPSTLLVRAKVWCDFMVDGKPVEYHSDFNGKKTWYLYPRQTSQGYFEVSKLLDKASLSFADMVAARNDSNAETQLTMDLRIVFRDELGNRREFPTRRHFFDFKAKRWVPRLTQLDDWN